MNEENLDEFYDLIDFVRDGRIIPVIGEELLCVEIDGQESLLYPYLARQLANELNVDSRPDDSLNSVIYRFLSKGRKIGNDKIYGSLSRIMPPLSQIKLPEPLAKLAEIRSFPLFITTCFDPILVHVLNKVRYGGEEKTNVLDFIPGKSISSSSMIQHADGSTVIHLFGKLTTVPHHYAVTDEDVLEVMHALQSRTYLPGWLLDLLHEYHLLVIGCPLTDWLVRFFVRIGKQERLVESKKLDYLAGDQLQNEHKLSEFFKYFSNETVIFPMTSVDFVNELHRRWIALPNPPKIENPLKEWLTGHNLKDMRSGSVFLSYASEDRNVVETIKDAMEGYGITVWFDRNPEALRVGEDFESKIKMNIDQCAVFIPIISRNTLTPHPRFFRKEWNHAEEICDRLPANACFILPLAIDDTAPDEAAIDGKIRSLHWERFDGKLLNPPFLSELKGLQDNYMSARA